MRIESTLRKIEKGLAKVEELRLRAEEYLGVKIEQVQDMIECPNFILRGADGSDLVGSWISLEKLVQIVYGKDALPFCAGCGKPIGYRTKVDPFGRKSRYPAYYSGVCSDECFDNLFWYEKYLWLQRGDQIRPDQLAARIGGKHYVLNPGDDGKTVRMRGHGGTRFMVQFISGPHKGQVIVTNDVWHQGVIPDVWRPLLPDNAILITVQGASDEEWLRSASAFVPES